MTTYTEMYGTLFRAMTKAITLLQGAQQQTEEIYITAKDPVIIRLQPLKDGDENKDGNRKQRSPS